MKVLKAGKVITAVLRVFSMIGVVLCLVMAVTALVNPQWLLENGTFTVNGIEISRPLEQIDNPAAPMAIIFLTGAVAMFLVTLMMHRMHGIIVKTIEGTPFQPCTVKWMRQIGWCAVIMPLVGAAMSLVAALISVGGIYAQLDLSGLLMGILVLCLTHVFAYGLELQQDVDGLL